MEKEIVNVELTDKKSYAGIPEAEFVVSSIRSYKVYCV